MPLGQTAVEIALSRRCDEQLSGMGRRSNELGTTTTSPSSTRSTGGPATWWPTYPGP